MCDGGPWKRGLRIGQAISQHTPLVLLDDVHPNASTVDDILDQVLAWADKEHHGLVLTRASSRLWVTPWLPGWRIEEPTVYRCVSCNDCNEYASANLPNNEWQCYSCRQSRRRHAF